MQPRLLPTSHEHAVSLSCFLSCPKAPVTGNQQFHLKQNNLNVKTSMLIISESVQNQLEQYQLILSNQNIVNLSYNDIITCFYLSKWTSCKQQCIKIMELEHWNIKSSAWAQVMQNLILSMSNIDCKNQASWSIIDVLFASRGNFHWRVNEVTCEFK